MTLDYRGTTALITGASSGLGAEFARQLAARGANLVLVARRLERLDSLASELTASHGITATAVAADLAAPGAAADLHAALGERGIRISTLINNAGFGTRSRFENEDAGRIHEEISLNVTALVELTHVFYAQLQAGHGALVTLASTAAYQPVPQMAVYGASKAFVLSFTEALWYENKDTGLSVLALSPGATRTEFFDVAGAGARVGDFEEPADVVGLALSTLDGKNPPPSVISGGRNRAMAIASTLAPRRTVVNLTGSMTDRNPA